MTTSWCMFERGMEAGFQCATCGVWHDELPLNFSFAEPMYVDALDQEQRSRMVSGVGDFRELQQDGEKHYFIKGWIEIPIIGTDDVFAYGVWTSLSTASWQAAQTAYADGTEAGPLFGWLSNSFPNYPDTVNLKTHVFVRVEERSIVEIEPTDHPLAVEQREGITMERVKEILAAAMHAAA